MFKFARGLDQLAELLSADCERGRGGKFITAYPEDDAQFRRLAAELDRVTDGMPGPVILSDRRLRPGSLVFYRYGVFNASPVLSNDGQFESMLVGPDGRREKDRGLARFNPPAWAVSPWPDPPSAGAAVAGAGATPEAAARALIGGRFVAREVIRQSYRGGVFRATDQRTGTDVILKQRRAHVQGSFTGTDGRDALRHEADMLDVLAPLGLTPTKVALFTHREDLFLAEELVPGVTLRRWTSDRATDRWQCLGAPLAEAMEKAGQLVELMTTLHEQGLVLRDFTPDNVMVTPDERLRLIGVECVTSVGARVMKVGTPGYTPAEHEIAPEFGPAPSQHSDLFSLGATIFWLASGIDPVLPVDQPADRSQHERLGDLVSLSGVRMEAVRHLAPLVLGLVRDDPEQRWTLERAREFLAGAPVSASEHDGDGLPITMVDRLLADGLSHVLRTMTPEAPRLWKADTYGETTDPCNVQYGAAGVLGVLTRSAQVLGGEHLRDGVASVAGWVQQRLFDVPRILPGLYYGRSGTAWSLYDAAQFLGDEKMAEQAIALAKQLPVEWPNPDICHGVAGAGMTHFYLWQATGDPELKRRGIKAADCLLRAAGERDGQLVWPIPETFDSYGAGLVHYGFAHGVAGAGEFLLYSALATGRSEYMEAACGAGETLAAVANVEGDTVWWWPRGEKGDPARYRTRHWWCQGSSGIGTFLIRLWLATGEQRFRELAEAVGAAIRRDKWYSFTATCHGLAGEGDFLLDLADFTGMQHYRDWAGELAAVMHARHSIRDGLMVLPDESGVAVTAGYGTGLSGAVGFLLRLRHGGPRLWMLDEFLDAECRARSNRDQPLT
jgi:hypothetical protein